MASSKKAMGILVAILSACALCFALVACSSGPASSASEPASKEAAFVGKWVVSEITQGGETITPETADAEMKEKIDSTYLDIKEDGTIEVSDMGMVESSTWEVTSDNEATAKLKDVTITMKIEGDKLVAISESTDAVLTFHKA